MKAIVYHNAGDLRIEDLPIPDNNSQEMLVKIDACAVCGTDLKSYKHGNPRIKPPSVIGHEFTGLIDKIGVKVRGFSVGERIVMATSVSCGKCYYCRQGWNNLCLKIAPMGFHYPGGMAEYTVIPSLALENGHVIKVPTSVDANHASLAEPLSCAINAVDNCDLQKGNTVVVLGAGPMGLMNVCVARNLGASKIILSEVSDKRLQQASNFNIDVLVNPQKENLEQIVKTHTNNLGADIVIVTAPAIPPQEMAINLVRKRGTVCLFSSLPVGNEKISLNSRIVHYGEIRLVGTSDSAPRHVQQAVDLIHNGKIPAQKLVSHILKLGEFEKAFKFMESGEALRVVLKP
jgi:L-iditol 2-dehydrogenase